MTATPANSVDGSWVEVESDSVMEATEEQHTDPVPPNTGSVFENDNLSRLEKMLWEAQHESSPPSVVSSRLSSLVSPTTSSPRTPNSPNSPLVYGSGLLPLPEEDLERRYLVSAEWLWEWHSRPDILKADRKLEIKAAEQQNNGGIISKWLERRGLLTKEVFSMLLLKLCLAGSWRRCWLLGPCTTCISVEAKPQH